jgi:hypothetical protein
MLSDSRSMDDFVKDNGLATALRDWRKSVVVLDAAIAAGDEQLRGLSPESRALLLAGLRSGRSNPGTRP